MIRGKEKNKAFENKEWEGRGGFRAGCLNGGEA